MRKLKNNPQVLRRLAVVILITLVAGLAYSIAVDHTRDAKNERKLNETYQRLDSTKKKLEQTKTENETQLKAKDQKIDEVNKQLDEANKALQAKRNKSAVYAAENTAPKAAAVKVSGSCAEWLAQAGITNSDAVWLIGKESGCRPDAINPSSGACGIPQALPCSKLPCTLQDPVCQLKWMETYVASRYGTWAKARAFHLVNNWY